MIAVESPGDKTKTEIFLIQNDCRTAANAKKSCDGDVSGKTGDTRFDLESIISKLLIGVTPNLIWVIQISE